MSVRRYIANIHRLFQVAICDGPQGRKGWAAVKQLRRHGNRIVFHRAAAWIGSSSAVKRARGCDILCQLRKHPGQKATSFVTPEPIFTRESFTLIVALLSTEKNDEVILSALYALKHLDIEEAVPYAAPYLRDERVEFRRAVTHLLGSYTNNEEAIFGLLILCRDPDKDIRDWALFAVGSQSDADTVEIRTILAEALHDPYRAAREEAIAGLAKRNDERAVLPLFRMLRHGSYACHNQSECEILLGQSEPDEGWTPFDMAQILKDRYPAILTDHPL